MDTTDLYERGVADAYRGTPHPFYYQNFEPYRRAYDHTRRHIRKTNTIPVIDMRRWIINGVFVVAVIAITLAIWHFTTTTIIVKGQAPRTPVILPTLAPSQLIPITTPTLPPPTSEPLALKKGGRALIQHTDKNPLRVRISPAVDAKIVAYMHDDEVVEIVEGPILADGLVWWQIKGISGIGWSAQSNNQGITWIIPVP